MLSRQPHQVLHGNNRIEEIVRLDNRRQMAFVHQRSPHRPALVSAQTLDFLLHLVLDFAAYLALPFPSPGSLSLAHERDGREALGAVVELAVAVAEVLHPEAVRLVFLVVEGGEFVDRDLVELVEVGPPLPAAAEVVVQEC